MPSINADGTINTSTDGAFVMDNEDEYYHFVCGLISASVNIKGRKAGDHGVPLPVPPSDDDDKKEYIDPDVIDIKTPTQRPGLVCCLNTGDHFYHYILDDIDPEELEQRNREIQARFGYQKRLGDPRWDITLDYPVFYNLVNTSTEAITFNEVVITFNAAGISNWQSSVTQDCQPYAAEIKGGTMTIDSRFTISESDRNTLEQYFGIQKTDVGIAMPAVRFKAAAPVTIRPHESVPLLHLSMIMGGKTVYINGETPVKITPNFWGVEYSIFGAYGQDGKGGFYAMPSYAYNTSTLKTYGIESHCSCVRFTGARWYERWSEEYPGTYWTYEKNGQTIKKPQSSVVPPTPSTKVIITTYVKNQTDTPANMTIRLYGQQYVYTIPAGYNGQTEIEIDVPPSISLTDNTSLNISSQFSIEVDRGEVSHTIVSVSNDPTIPTIPTIRSSKHQQLGLVDKLVMTLTGTKNPDVTDGLTLVDSAYVTLRRKIDKPAEDSLLLLDSAYVTLRRKIDKPAEDSLLLLDSAYVTLRRKIDNNVLDGLTLVDQAYVTHRAQISGNTTTNDILVLSDKALVSK